MSPQSSENAVNLSKWKCTSCLVIIILIGFLHRAWNINNISLWLDEFVTTYKLFQGSISDFFSYFFAFHSDQAPIAHITYYFFYRLFPYWFSEIDNLRWISVLIGTLNVFLVYKLAKSIYPERVGLFSALIFAISPYHTLFSQLIRPYVFMELFSVLSILATVRFIKKPYCKNFLLWILSALFLFLSHFMMILLIILEVGTVFIYLFAKREYKKAIAYSLIPLLILSLILLFFLSKSVPIYTVEDDYLMGPPGIFNLLIDLFADDAVLSSEPFFYQGQTSAFTSTLAHWVGEVVNIHHIFDIVLIIIGVTATVYPIISLLQKWKEIDNRNGEIRKIWALLSNPSEHLFEMFLFTIVVLPLLIVVFVSFIRPCYQTRYTLYSSIALYILIGNLVKSTYQSNLRKILIAWLSVSLIFNIFIGAISVKTTNFKGMADILSKHLEENDTILAWGIFFFTIPITNEITGYYLKQPSEKIIPVYSLKDTLQKVREVFDKSNNDREKIWLIIEPYVFDFPNEDAIDYILWKLKIDYEKYFFPGMNGLWLYKLNKKEDSFSENFDIPNFIDYSSYLNFISRVCPGYDIRKAEETLSTLIDFPAPPTIMFWNYIALCALDRNNPEFAEICARCAITLNPNLPWGYHSLAVSLIEQGRLEESLKALKKCVDKDSSGYHRKKYEPLFKAIYIDKDMSLGKILIRTLDSEGGLIPVVYKRRVGIINS